MVAMTTTAFAGWEIFRRGLERQPTLTDLNRYVVRTEPDGTRLYRFENDRGALVRPDWVFRNWFVRWPLVWLPGEVFEFTDGSELGDQRWNEDGATPWGLERDLNRLRTMPPEGLRLPDSIPGWVDTEGVS